MANKSFILHIDSLCILDKLTDEQKGKLFDAIYRYQLTGEVNTLDQLTEIVFTPFLNQFKRDAEKYQSFVAKQAENGKRGGRPKNPSLLEDSQKTQAFLEKPKKAYNDSVSKNDSVSVNTDEIELHKTFAKKIFENEGELQAIEVSARRKLTTQLLSQFNAKLKVTGETHIHFSEYKKHLMFWLMKQPEQTKTKNKL